MRQPTRRPPALGSSPRVRGRRSSGVTFPPRRGLIPAGAGQTNGRTQGSCRGRAHPRGCGADVNHSLCFMLRTGSSPRVRGRRGQPTIRSIGQRLIPAGAGQTPHGWRAYRRSRAHPRGCGADEAADELSKRVQGSSPRVRGRPAIRRAAGAALGLIPAGAGRTYRDQKQAPASGAHPRGCGADSGGCGGQRARRGLIPAGAGQTPLRFSQLKFELGSSPRVRGRRPAAHAADHAAGLIPAGAGQTFWVFYVCTWALGSSPRVRGRPSRPPSVWNSPGLIPAGAGQTHLLRARSRSGPAHPRGCGADRFFNAPLRSGNGSSPRVRGRPG